MKRMLVIGLVFFAVLTVGALLVRRAARTASLPPRAVQPIDRLQGGVKLDRNADYTLDAAAKAKLRSEELRQRPWEGRN